MPDYFATVTAKPEPGPPPVPQTVHAFAMSTEQVDADDFEPGLIVFATITALCGKAIGYAPARHIDFTSGSWETAVDGSAVTCAACVADSEPVEP